MFLESRSTNSTCMRVHLCQQKRTHLPLLIHLPSAAINAMELHKVHLYDQHMEPTSLSNLTTRHSVTNNKASTLKLQKKKHQAQTSKQQTLLLIINFSGASDYSRHWEDKHQNKHNYKPLKSSKLKLKTVQISKTKNNMSNRVCFSSNKKLANLN